MKTRQFEFLNNPNVIVLGEKGKKYDLFPHTQQLQTLWTKIDKHFRLPIANKFQRADKRASDSIKASLYEVAMAYCGLFNNARSDKIQLHALPSPDLVTHITIVQQITIYGSAGNLHGFWFYGGPTFSAEIRLGGKHLLLASHVLEQFRKRYPDDCGLALSNLINVLFQRPWMIATINGSPMLIISYDPTIFAFPFEEQEDRFILKTCLTVNEIHSFELNLPVTVYNLHYSQKYRPPPLRTWDPEKEMKLCHERWVKRAPMSPPLAPMTKREDWTHLAYKLTNLEQLANFTSNEVCQRRREPDSKLAVENGTITQKARFCEFSRQYRGCRCLGGIGGER